jgi:hypothetical protein
MDGDVPSRYWPEVLESLSPSEIDSDPLKWEIVGELRITTKDDATIYVALLFMTPGELGAFCAGGKNWHTRKHFRGGDSDRLRTVLSEALHAQDSATH